MPGQTAQINAAKPEGVALAAGDEDTPEPGTFSMCAYTGGVAHVGWYGRMVFNLQGIKWADEKKVPILYEHKRDQVAALSTALSISDNGLMAKGKMFADYPPGDKIVALSQEKYPWKASVGLDAEEIEYVPKGEKIRVNNSVFEGPLYYVGASQLNEISFVTLAADDNTYAVAANKGLPMPQDTTNQTTPPTPAPAPAPVKAAKATIAELRAAFPDDAEFVLEQAEKGVSLLEARANYGAVLQERNKALTEELNAARATPPAPTRPTQNALPASNETETVEAAAGPKWRAAIKAHKERGLDHFEAMQAAARENPALQRAAMVEANRGNAPSVFGLNAR